MIANARNRCAAHVNIWQICQEIAEIVAERRKFGRFVGGHIEKFAVAFRLWHFAREIPWIFNFIARFLGLPSIHNMQKKNGWASMKLREWTQHRTLIFRFPKSHTADEA